jgi:hypothetical protein
MDGDADTRDIDLVLVTGAGASVAFGAERRFPLMKGFADAIRAKVVETPNANTMVMNNMLPLDKGISGPDFERVLGRFLRQAEAFRGMEPLLKPSLDLFQIHQAVKGIQPSGKSALEEWHWFMQVVIDELIEVLNQTLFDLFASRINTDAAASGYGWLLGQLGITSARSSFVYATTNYDTVGENALRVLGYNIEWGRPPQLVASADEVVRVDRLIERLPGVVPVLHLHGRVGWYIRRLDLQRQVTELISPIYNKDSGVPVVVWPDDTKDASTYSAQPIIDSLWSQFRQTLGRAQKVLVLGHSLNDRILIEAISTNVPTHRIAVTVFDGPDHDGVVARAREAFGSNVATLLLDFNKSPQGNEEPARWAERVDQLG